MRILSGKHLENEVTSTTRSPIICECGHQGHLVCSENDQPFSKLWEDYSLGGFSGDELTITSYANKPKNMLAALKPKCPECGETGKVKYAKGAQ
jgi:hypothetical protein